MRSLFLLLFLASISAASAQTNTLNLPAVSSGTAPSTNTTAASPSSALPAPAPTPSDAEARTLRDSAQMIHNGDLDGALTKLNAVILADPRSVNAFVLRGQVYVNKKLVDLAANDFEAAHLLDPANPVVSFDVAEVKFTQKSYDAARIGFVELAKDKSTLLGDLSSYKVFLCDLLGNHPDEAQKEFDAFNQVGSGASYYYANAAWSIVHHQTEDARGWLASAGHIYTPQKNALYVRSLTDVGMLPLPAAPAK